MPRSVGAAAALSFLLHGGLVLAGRYRASYDAYNHMFFGDHYRRDWWSLWEDRWYTGFEINSYPPLVHQLIGALGHVTGIDAAFALLLWAAVTVLPLAVYAFARTFTGRTASGYAALGAAFLPSVSLTAHIFGQLPTLAAIVTALLALAALNRYLLGAGRLYGALSVSFFATVVALHHATLLFVPWGIAALGWHLLAARRVPGPVLAVRLLTIGLVSALAALIVVWPFWAWGHGQSLQTPIDHPSRHNFLQDPLAAAMFFLPVYGPLIPLIPAAIWLAHRRKLPGLGLAFLMLFLLGLGGTTPLPAFLFGDGWQWLTYDRFAFWASLLLLPFFGMWVILLRRRRRGIRTGLFATLAAASLTVGLLTAFLPLQPGQVKMAPVVDFLEEDDHSSWRYLTFGFGDQFALLSMLTTATTIDGSYHTARTLPGLRASGIGQIDTAFWLPDGLSRLDPILQNAGIHGVRWGFVNVPQYIPVLERHDWVKIRILEGGVQVWENPAAVRPPPSGPDPTDPLASFSWGTLPLLSLVTSGSLGFLALSGRRAERVLRGAYGPVAAAIPLASTLWYFTTVQKIPYARIYFTYTDALFFFGDALMLTCVIIWLSTRTPPPASSGWTPARTAAFGLCLLALCSIFWSPDWRTSLYVAVHIGLVGLFAVSLRDAAGAWRLIMVGLCFALVVQFVAAFTSFVHQSTAVLPSLHLQWPGTLDSTTPGAVVVGLPDGGAVLRAYGTLPHPNILGGFALIFLLGPVALWLSGERPNRLACLLIPPGTALLALTFSRSAWLALAAFCLVLFWKRRHFERRRLITALLLVVVSLGVTLLPLRQLVQARTLRATAPSEVFSLVGRAWLNEQALQMIREHPLTGVGAGAFIIELAQRAGEGYVIEPAHSIPLLAGAELGLPGLLLVFVLLASFAYSLIRTVNPMAILTGAVLTGLGVIGLLDHYFWTLAPGRLMLGLAIGLYLGQAGGHDA